MVFRIKPIKEWRPTTWFAPVRHVLSRLFWTKRNIKVSELKNSGLRKKFSELGVAELSKQHGDLIRDEAALNTALNTMIQAKPGKKTKLTYFDIFEQQRGGTRLLDIDAIKHYYRVNTGKDLKYLTGADQRGKQSKIKIDELSAGHAAWMHEEIVQKLRNGSTLSDALDFTGRPTATAAPTASAWQPPTRGDRWAAAAVVAGGLALGANFFGPAMVKERASQTQQVVNEAWKSPAQRAVASQYRQTNNYGVNLPAMAEAWKHHKVRVGAPEARDPEYYAGKLMNQWEAYVQRLGKQKGFNGKVTRAHMMAFIKGRVSGGPTEVNTVVNAAFNYK